MRGIVDLDIVWYYYYYYNQIAYIQTVYTYGERLLFFTTTIYTNQYCSFCYKYCKKIFNLIIHINKHYYYYLNWPGKFILLFSMKFWVEWCFLFFAAASYWSYEEMNWNHPLLIFIYFKHLWGQGQRILMSYFVMFIFHYKHHNFNIACSSEKQNTSFDSEFNAEQECLGFLYFLTFFCYFLHNY